MTREEFIQVLEAEEYPYEIEGDNIVVTYGGSVWLDSLKVLPSGVEFKNEVSVYLNSLEVLPSGVEFKNKGSVYLRSLEEIPPGVVFENGWDVYLNSLIGGWLKNCEANIDGIANKMLLNVMIKRGLFI